jgi:predicted  nucleic acid-binding Zn-ribbon protein
VDLSAWGIGGSDEHFDDPIALAQQAIAAIGQIDSALDNHLQQLEDRRDRTKSAAQQLKEHREQLRTKSLKAELRAEFIGHEIKQGEADLQQAIESLGKGESAA